MRRPMSMVQRRVCGLRSPAGQWPTTHRRTSGKGYILAMLQMPQGCRMKACGLRASLLLMELKAPANVAGVWLKCWYDQDSDAIVVLN